LAFALAGLQKVVFNPLMSSAAEHHGFSKLAYQRVGVIELAGAVGVIVGVAVKRSTFLGVFNVAAAAGLFVAMVFAAYFHVRKGDEVKQFAPAMVLGVLAP
jgi:hypothetical protein